MGSLFKDFACMVVIAGISEECPHESRAVGAHEDAEVDKGISLSHGR